MKKLFALFLVLILALVSTAVADIDLTGMSLDELIALQNQITLAMWATDEWQEVKVPAGMYKIGESIPAGRWTIKALPDEMLYITYGNHVNRTMTEILDEYGDEYDIQLVQAMYSSSVFSPSEITFELEDGFYLHLSSGAIFTPYIPANFGFSFK